MSFYSVENFSILNEHNELISAGASLGVFGLTRKLKKKNNKKNIKEKLIKKKKNKKTSFRLKLVFILVDTLISKIGLFWGSKNPHAVFQS